NLTAEVLRHASGTVRAKALVDSWIENNQAIVDFFMELMSDLKSNDTVDFAMLSVAVSEVHKLLRGETPKSTESASAA
ncbi:MAG: hypothetical protein V3T12_01835, partial [Acidiferrobacterales bacterium]